MSLHSPAAEFAVLSKTILASNGSIAMANNMVASLPKNLASDRVVDLIRKDAASAIGTEDLQYRILTNAFFESLRTTAAYVRMVSDKAIRTVPANARVVSNTYAFSGDAVAEGAVKPIRELSLSGSALPEYKSTCLIVVSDEIQKLATSDAVNFLNAEQRATVSMGMDGLFFSEIVDSATPVITSSGLTGSAVLDDLAEMIASMNTAGALYFVAHSTTAKALSVAKTQDGTRAFPEAGLQGGELLGAPLIVSDALNAGELLLVNASAFVGNFGTIRLDASEQAALIMENGGQPVSLWQHGLSCLRAEVFFGFEQVQPDAVAVLSGLELPVQS